MVAYMLADGCTDGVIARVMGWTIGRVSRFGEWKRYPHSAAAKARELARLRARTQERLERAWEEKRREG